VVSKSIARYEREMIRSIGCAVKSLRLQHRLTVKQLSVNSGMTQQTIAYIESGTGERVDLVKLCRLAKALEVPLVDLLESGGIPREAADTWQTDSKDECDTALMRPYHPFCGAVGYSVLGANAPTFPFLTQNALCISLNSTTLEVWFYPMGPARDGEQKLLSLHQDTYHDIYFGWQEERVWFGIIPGKKEDWIHLRSAPCALFEWHHAVGVVDGNWARLYIDQVEVAQVSLRDFSSFTYEGQFSVGYIPYGHDELAKDSKQTFIGQIIQPCVWTEPLSPYGLKKKRADMLDELTAHDSRILLEP